MKKTNIVFRTKLIDGNYLCSGCTQMVPSYIFDTVIKEYGLDDFRALKEYIKKSNEILRPKFTKTIDYSSLHIDAEHKLFCIGDPARAETVILQFDNLDEFDLDFSVEEFKEGIIGDKVVGKILLHIKMEVPYFEYDKVLDDNAKGKASKSFFGTKVKYENPKGMNEFLEVFCAVWEKSISEAYAEFEQTADADDDFIEEDMKKAMALFMVEDIDEISLEKVKVQRNRLMKTFHPDVATEEDVKYAQTINKAYEVLKAYKQRK